MAFRQYFSNHLEDMASFKRQFETPATNKNTKYVNV